MASEETNSLKQDDISAQGEGEKLSETDETIEEKAKRDKNEEEVKKLRSLVRKLRDDKWQAMKSAGEYKLIIQEWKDNFKTLQRSVQSQKFILAKVRGQVIQNQAVIKGECYKLHTNYLLALKAYLKNIGLSDTGEMLGCPECHSLRKQLSGLQEELTSREKILTQTEQALEKNNQEYSVLKTTHNQLKEAYQKKDQSSEEKYKRLQKDLQETESELEKVREELKNYKINTNQQLKADKDKILQATITMNEMETMKDLLEKTNQHLTQIEQGRDRIEEEIFEKEEKMKKRQKKVEMSLTQSFEKEKQSLILRLEMQEKQQKKKLKEELQEERDKNKELQEQCEKEIKKKEAMLRKKLKTTNQKLENRIRAMTEDFAKIQFEQQTRIEKLQKEINKLKVQLKENIAREEQVPVQDSIVQNLEDIIADNYMKIDELEEVLSERDEEIEDIQRKLKRNKSDLQEEIKRNYELCEIIQKLRKELVFYQNLPDIAYSRTSVKANLANGFDLNQVMKSFQETQKRYPLKQEGKEQVRSRRGSEVNKTFGTVNTASLGSQEQFKRAFPKPRLAAIRK